MKNPQYYRIMLGGKFKGFRRITVESLPAGHDKWKLEELEHDEFVKINCAPMGIDMLKRPSLGKKISSSPPPPK